MKARWWTTLRDYFSGAALNRAIRRNDEAARALDRAVKEILAK